MWWAGSGRAAVSLGLTVGHGPKSRQVLKVLRVIFVYKYGDGAVGLGTYLIHIYTFVYVFVIKSFHPVQSLIYEIHPQNLRNSPDRSHGLGAYSAPPFCCPYSSRAFGFT